MKWFRHFCSDSAHNPAVVELESRWGPQGYMMYYKLVELLVDGIDHREDLHPQKLSLHQLCFSCKCKQKKAKEFLSLLQDKGVLKVTFQADIAIIEMPKLLDLLHKDAGSSWHRQSAGPPRREDNRKEKNMDLLFEKEKNMKMSEAEKKEFRDTLSGFYGDLPRGFENKLWKLKQTYGTAEEFKRRLEGLRKFYESGEYMSSGIDPKSLIKASLDQEIGN